MADKVIKSIAEKQSNGEFGDAIPIGADAENVKLKSGQSVEAAVTEVKQQIETNKNALEQQVSDRAPTNHASTNETYGVATDNKFGHVKISGDVQNLGLDAEKTALSIKKAREISETATAANTGMEKNKQSLELLGQFKANRSHKHQTSDIVGLDEEINEALDANNLLTKIKTVDGEHSGLDADMIAGRRIQELITRPEFNEFQGRMGSDMERKMNIDNVSFPYNKPIIIQSHASNVPSRVFNVVNTTLTISNLKYIIIQTKLPYGTVRGDYLYRVVIKGGLKDSSATSLQPSLYDFDAEIFLSVSSSGITGLSSFYQTTSMTNLGLKRVLAGAMGGGPGIALEVTKPGKYQFTVDVQILNPTEMNSIARDRFEGWSLGLYAGTSSGFIQLTEHSVKKKLDELFQSSVNGKSKIATAINGIVGSSVANQNMSFDGLKREISKIDLSFNSALKNYKNVELLYMGKTKDALSEASKKVNLYLHEEGGVEGIIVIITHVDNHCDISYPSGYYNYYDTRLEFYDFNGRGNTRYLKEPSVIKNVTSTPLTENNYTIIYHHTQDFRELPLLETDDGLGGATTFPILNVGLDINWNASVRGSSLASQAKENSNMVILKVKK